MSISKDDPRVVERLEWAQERGVLNLRALELQEVPGWVAELEGLTGLHLGSNQIASVDNVTWPQELIELDLSSNQIANVDNVQWPTRLTRLDLGYNQLASVNKVVWPQGLAWLYLAANQIPSVDKVTWPRWLVCLFLNGNQIAGVDRVEWPERLTELCLIENPELGIPWDVLFGNDAPKIIAWLRQREVILPELKVAVLGEAYAGKSTLVRRLAGREIDPDIDRTVSFEWQPVRMKVVRDSRITGEKLPDDAEVTFNIFDFGGQERLRTAHRFFMSNQRTLYVLLADGRKTVEENRLRAWVDFVIASHEEWLRFEAIAQVRRERRAREQAGQRDGGRFARGGGGVFESRGAVSRFDEEAAIKATIEELRKSRPRPPMHLVVSHCDECQDARTRKNLEANQHSSLALAKEHGLTCTLDYGDRLIKDRRPPRLDDIMGHLRQMASKMEQLWLEKYPVSFGQIVRTFRDKFGFHDTADDGEDFHERPGEPYLTLAAAKELIAKAITKGSGDEAIDAETYLAILRSLGFVHFLGDRADVSERDEVKRIVMNPRWVRGPVYDVLWAENAAGMPVVEEGELLELLEGKQRTSRTKRPAISAEEARLVLGLMIACGLVIEARGEAGVKRYVVPDWMGDSVPDSTGRAIESWEAGYAARESMARVFACLHAKALKGHAVSIHGFMVKSDTGLAQVRLVEPATVGSQYRIELVELAKKGADLSEVRAAISEHFRELRRKEEEASRRSEGEIPSGSEDGILSAASDRLLLKLEQLGTDRVWRQERDITHAWSSSRLLVMKKLRAIDRAEPPLGPKQRLAAYMMVMWCHLLHDNLDWKDVERFDEIDQMCERLKRELGKTLPNWKPRPVKRKKTKALGANKAAHKDEEKDKEKQPLDGFPKSMKVAWKLARTKLGMPMIKPESGRGRGRAADHLGNPMAPGDEVTDKRTNKKPRRD
jgi:Leucine-rich repeat (LRR) protein